MINKFKHYFIKILFRKGQVKDILNQITQYLILILLILLLLYISFIGEFEFNYSSKFFDKNYFLINNHRNINEYYKNILIYNNNKNISNFMYKNSDLFLFIDSKKIDLNIDQLQKKEFLFRRILNLKNDLMDKKTILMDEKTIKIDERMIRIDKKTKLELMFEHESLINYYNFMKIDAHLKQLPDHHLELNKYFNNFQHNLLTILENSNDPEDIKLDKFFKKQERLEDFYTDSLNIQKKRHKLLMDDLKLQLDKSCQLNYNYQKLIISKKIDIDELN